MSGPACPDCGEEFVAAEDCWICPDISCPSGPLCDLEVPDFPAPEPTTTS